MPQITLNINQTKKFIDFAKKHNVEKFFIAKDQGAYIGINTKNAKEKIIHYFNGCNPDRNEEWYENCHYKFGGDDFGEMLDLAKIKEWPTGLKLRVKLTSSYITVEGIH